MQPASLARAKAQAENKVSKIRRGIERKNGESGAQTAL